MRFAIDAVFLGNARSGSTRARDPSCPSIAGCGPGPGSCRWSAARTACWSSPSARSSGAGRRSGTSSCWSRPSDRVSAEESASGHHRSMATLRRLDRSRRSISHFRPRVPAAVVRASRCAPRACPRSMRGWRCPAGRRSDCRPSCPRRCSSSSGARPSPGRSGQPSTTSSTPGSGGLPGRSAMRSPGAGRGSGPAPRSSFRSLSMPSASARRGYDQAALIAEVAGERLGLPVVRALERQRATVAQFELGRDERAANVDGAFRVAPAWSGRGARGRGALDPARRRRRDDRRDPRGLRVRARTRRGAGRLGDRRRPRALSRGDRPTRVYSEPEGRRPDRPRRIRSPATGPPLGGLREDDRQGQERRSPGSRPRVRGAQTQADASGSSTIRPTPRSSSGASTTRAPPTPTSSRSR